MLGINVTLNKVFILYIFAWSDIICYCGVKTVQTMNSYKVCGDQREWADPNSNDSVRRFDKECVARKADPDWVNNIKLTIL